MAENPQEAQVTREEEEPVTKAEILAAEQKQLEQKFAAEKAAMKPVEEHEEKEEAATSLPGVHRDRADR